ncbi:hypothetical protein [Microvirga subterranea]|uniref:hypothetical protein n=1 Tax=Microvirga subterranea TaxID=186651 RepID=UPI0014732DC6|nr:hypothetical protein [Microvirga subterranea]
MIWFGWIWVMNWPCIPPLWFMAEEPMEEDEFMLEEPAEEPADGLAAAPGCMAFEPVAVEPELEAAGRSVAPDGVVEVCAKAGAANMVATRQAAICFFSIG